ncbi:MAG: hypothetical protein J0I17_12050 ['Candidatus Kapabacteria' thiocyanatum]|uniref:Uncharacterized protein n=1 Tax=Candidatus Kapaibacterium thiocyanatum TaxID=1895771 RepID=A0A1M3L332_9BACT|nr:hypothetical protein ['Candidatus Kapabacteria' thiocyanatum]OJX59728.1 MAG: hypothetical protein BGO89_05805 ['Candidatus Kapabacteria' thiocyanatum]
MIYVIVRVSLDKDEKSLVRNTILAPIFNKHNFANTKTGTWEVECRTSAAALEAVAELMGELQGACAERDSLLDHIWIMLDKWGDKDE